MKRPSLWAAALVFAAMTALMLGLGLTLRLIDLTWAATLPGRLALIAASTLLAVGLPLAVYFARSAQALEWLRLNLPSARYVLTTALAAALGVPVIQYINVAFLALYNLLGIPVYSALFSAIPSASSGDELMIIVCVMAILPALLEELMFRGVIMRALEARGRRVALIGSALLFAAVHASLLQLPALFVVGLAIGFVVMAGDSLLLGMVYHFVHNAASLIYDHMARRVTDIPASLEGAKFELDRQLADPGIIAQVLIALAWLGTLYFMALVLPYRRALSQQMLGPRPARESVPRGAVALMIASAAAFLILGFMNIFSY